MPGCGIQSMKSACPNNVSAQATLQNTNCAQCGVALPAKRANRSSLQTNSKCCVRRSQVVTRCSFWTTWTHLRRCRRLVVHLMHEKDDYSINPVRLGKIDGPLISAEPTLGRPSGDVEECSFLAACRPMRSAGIDRPCENAKLLGIRVSFYPSWIAATSIQRDLKGRVF